MMHKKSGLVYNKQTPSDDTSWVFDSSSIESFGSSWNSIGYEIIFRLEEIRASDNMIKEVKEVFMRSFGLPLWQYSFKPTFWRVYWDLGQVRASMIKKCEDALDKVAKRHGIIVKLNGVIIQPRPMGYIKHHIESNKS